MRHRQLRSDHIGSRASEGTRLLWGVLKREGWSQNRLAEELGADSGKVNRWLHGTLRPTLAWALLLAERFGIAPETWNTPPRKPIVLRVGPPSTPPPRRTGTDG